MYRFTTLNDIKTAVNIGPWMHDYVSYFMVFSRNFREICSQLMFYGFYDLWKVIEALEAKWNPASLWYWRS